MTTSLASIDSARAISTICCSATERSETSRRGSTVKPDLGGRAPRVRRCSSPQSTRPPAHRQAADEHVLGHRQRRDQVEFLVDRDDAEQLRRMRAAQPHLGAVEGDRARVGRWAPARILSSVLLPAPFSPSSACTSPRPTSKSTAAQCLHAGKALGDPGHAQKQGLARPSPRAPWLRPTSARRAARPCRDWPW